MLYVMTDGVLRQGDAAAGLGSGVAALEAAQLLKSVAEQLKLPLTIIARQAELGETLGELPSSGLAAMQLQAQMALGLVDSYLLGLELSTSQQQLDLAPVSVSALLVETAHELHGLAKQYDTDIELSIAGRYEPVMAHAAGLKAALKSLGYALVAAGNDDGAGNDAFAGNDVGAGAKANRRRLLLAAHRTPQGIAAGMYGQFSGLHPGAWMKALELCGRAPRPFGMLTGESGAGLFVAETILRAMQTRLRVGRHSNHHGLATTLQPSQQLSLV